MLRHLLSSAVTLLAITLCAPPAHAQPPDVPPACSSVRNARSYNMGKQMGTYLVQQSWASVDDCDLMDYFMDVVAADIDSLTLPYGASDYLACRYAGTVDGAFDALDDLYGTCADACFVDGQLAGHMSARAYCELAIAFGGLGMADDFLRGPVQTCGLNFQVGCDSTFIGVTKSFANMLGMCEPYTRDEHLPVWNQARHNQCMYEPPTDEELKESAP